MEFHEHVLTAEREPLQCVCIPIALQVVMDLDHPRHVCNLGTCAVDREQRGVRRRDCLVVVEMDLRQVRTMLLTAQVGVVSIGDDDSTDIQERRSIWHVSCSWVEDSEVGTYDSAGHKTCAHRKRTE